MILDIEYTLSNTFLNGQRKNNNDHQQSSLNALIQKIHVDYESNSLQSKITMKQAIPLLVECHQSFDESNFPGVGYDSCYYAFRRDESQSATVLSVDLLPIQDVVQLQSPTTARIVELV